MGSKSTTVYETQNTTQEQKMPVFQEEFLKEDLLPVARQIASQPFEAYSGDRVAMPTEMQQQAYTGYENLALPETMRAAMDPAARQQRIMEIQNQMAPALNRQFAQQGIGKEAQAIKAGAFGDRRDVYEGERQAALDAQAYNLAAQELDRQAAQGLQALQTEQAILGAQMGAGEARRTLEQQGLDVDFAEFMRRQNYPLTQFGVLTGAAGAIPSGYGTTTGTSSGFSNTSVRDPMAGIGMGLQAFGGLGMAGIGPFSGLQGTGLTSNPFPYR